MALTDLLRKPPREWLSKPLVLSLETAIRPATLPKLDNGVEFPVVSMVNRYGISPAEGAVSRASLFVVFDVESATVERAVYDWTIEGLFEIPWKQSAKRADRRILTDTKHNEVHTNHFQ
jgi:hypothetical protein